MYADLERDPVTREVIEAIEHLKDQLGEPPTEIAACTPAPDAPSSGEATEIDGVWTMDTDRSAADPEYHDENWGHWVFVFDRGRFAITQENATSCTWGYGTYAVNGTRMSWTFEDGGGIAPNNAMNKPGEYFVFDFSAYRDTLTLDPGRGRDLSAQLPGRALASALRAQRPQSTSASAALRPRPHWSSSANRRSAKALAHAGNASACPCAVLALGSPPLPTSVDRSDPTHGWLTRRTPPANQNEIPPEPGRHRGLAPTSINAPSCPTLQLNHTQPGDVLAWRCRAASHRRTWPLPSAATAIGLRHCAPL